MTVMQTSLALLIVRQSILNPVINFSTHLWPVKWNALYVIHLSRAFHSISSNVDATHAPTWSTMIWSSSYHHVIILVHRSWLHLLFIIASVHRRQVLLNLHRHARSLTSKPPTCPSHLQPVCRAKSCLDLLHLNHMTQCHVSCAMSSFIITCVSFATTPSHLHRHGIYCLHTCTCGLITCVSHINTISPPKVVTQLTKPNKNFSRMHGTRPHISGVTWIRSLCIYRTEMGIEWNVPPPF
jgi:hypothetical protein